MEKQNFSALNDIPGLRFVPCKETKNPVPKGWQHQMTPHDLSDCVYVGLVCGEPSGGLEVIDIDEKYSLDGKLCEKYKKQIHETDPLLLKKLVVQKTKNGGFHFIYRCSVISGNSKLARRPTTDRERKETYDKTYKFELTNDKNKDGEEGARKLAEKAYKNDKVRVLLETRGIGGQIICDPSPGYSIIHGDIYGINEITPEERDILFSVAMQFNEVYEAAATPRPPTGRKTEGLSVFDDYNDRGDVVGLLESNGWRIMGNKGKKTVFLRPGQTTSQSSGNYDHEKKWFSVFTTSTEFNPETAYLPYAVYAVLECNGNYSEASKKLYELGYGERHQEKQATAVKPSTRVIPSRINADDDDYSFLATPEDYDEYLQQVIDGTLPQGLTTGIPSLDRFFMFKLTNMVNTNGHDNAGKSVVVWYLALLSAMYHGWVWVIFSSENTLGQFMRKMIQFYWGKPIRGRFSMDSEEFKIAKDFVESHFVLIKSEEDMFNYKDIINMMKKAKKKIDSDPKFEKRELNAGMIDPYNSLKIDLSGFSKLNTHEFHYEALSELKLFGKKTGIGLWINHHAVTAALRQKDGEKKYPVAPQKADTESGGKVGNKTDDFITIHRITQHPTDWMVTELHVRKIKDTETGGRVTPIDDPVKLEMYKDGCAFKERLGYNDNRNPVDPIVEWHRSQGRSIETEIVPNVTWNPDNTEKDDNWTDVEF